MWDEMFFWFIFITKITYFTTKYGQLTPFNIGMLVSVLPNQDILLILH